MQNVFSRHGYIEKRSEPLTNKQVSSIYSKVNCRGNYFEFLLNLSSILILKTDLANFSHYTYNYYREYGKNVSSPIVWFVSHCKAHSGRYENRGSLGQVIIRWSTSTFGFRDKYIAWLQRYIGVDIYGKCGDMKCGLVKNVGNKYDTDEDPCFEMVNKKYRYTMHQIIFSALVQHTFYNVMI